MLTLNIFIIQFFRLEFLLQCELKNRDNMRVEKFQNINSFKPQTRFKKALVPNTEPYNNFLKLLEGTKKCDAGSLVVLRTYFIKILSDLESSHINIAENARKKFLTYLVSFEIKSNQAGAFSKPFINKPFKIGDLFSLTTQLIDKEQYGTMKEIMRLTVQESIMPLLTQKLSEPTLPPSGRGYFIF